ncbi:hypothetical protein MM300_15625 [Evansella sp. LMS18]|uniref:hypothetical protein n=1 Tax=Evansella sp. LMS18 TaxID=2924033 RepID=UPI0020D10BEB|nr:hypothetical protein [Evansella sp. LMS18]UTR09321.1 hypothetical protein MM300_15625 [Evansella sp. LMS18]
MKNNKTYTVSAAVFVVLLLSAVPFHISANNQIIERQTSEENIESFFIGGRPLEDLKFQPREYIQVDKQPVRE